MYRLEHEQGNFVRIIVSERLTNEDYERLHPELDAEIERHGEVRLVWDMRDFEGWTPGALWEDAKLDLRHNSDVSRLAMIGETRWQEWMARLTKPFDHAQVHYFDAADRETAYEWIREPE